MLPLALGGIKEEETITPALDKIDEAWKVASEEMYKAQAEQGGQPGGTAGVAQQGSNGTPGGSGNAGNAQADDVEDVDFEEVK